jgi:hypothetical protein
VIDGQVTLTQTSTSTPGVLERQQECVEQMGESCEQVGRVMLKESERCLRDFQKGKLATSFEECTTADRKGRLRKAQTRTEATQVEHCDSLAPTDLPLGYRGADSLNRAAVQGGLGIVHEIFGDPVDDGDLATRSSDKQTASCQYEVLKRASKLVSAIVEQVNEARKHALEYGIAADESALEAILATVFDPLNPRLARAERRLEKRLEKRCRSVPVGSAAIFPGRCADPDWDVAADCVIAAARCQACLAADAFHDPSLHCDAADDQLANASCP